MSSRWVVGAGDYLQEVLLIWQQANGQDAPEKIEIPQYRDYTFDLSPLDALSPSDSEVFVAIDERFGNFKRMELMQAVIARGFKLASFVHPSAVVGVDVKIGMNVFVGAHAVIGHATRIDYNSVVHAGVHIGPMGRIKSSCWIENGVQLGSAVELGAHCTIRMGASIRSGVKVGRGCELGWPIFYESDVPNKTVFDRRYDEPIHIYGA